MPKIKHCQVLAHTDRFGCRRRLTGLGELRQGLKRIAPDNEKYTKPKGERATNGSSFALYGFVIFHYRDYERKARLPPCKRKLLNLFCFL